MKYSLAGKQKKTKAKHKQKGSLEIKKVKCR